LSLSKYEDNSDPVSRPAVVLAAFSKALAELLLDREGMEEVPVPKPTDKLEAPPPSNAKILPQAIFFLPEEGCCAGFYNLTIPNLISYLLNMVANSSLTLVK
jgi:hypothetical protein